MSSHAAIKSEPLSDDNKAARKGKPLGSNHNSEEKTSGAKKNSLDRLGVTNLKSLHRLLFDHDGKTSSVFSNIEKFQGFSFPKGSAKYNRKKATLHKLEMDELNELIFCFDLDTKLNRKSKRVEEILKFLMSPRSKRSPRIYKCHNSGCGETFPNITASSHHKKTCSHQIAYFCHYCKKKFSHPSGLSRHKSNTCSRGIF